MDDYAWEEMLKRQKRFYANYGEDTFAPPADHKVFYDYLARRTGSYWHDDDELHHITIAEVEC